MKKLIPVLFAVTFVSQAFAQRTQPFRASITGGGGNGKCTIEVVVDGVAIVEISGDQGRLITTSGQPSEWRRFQCNQRMPLDPYDFRFRGIDGRGHVSLERDPHQNRGVVAVRIEDTQGGREGYTFDLEWRGGDDRPGGNGPGAYDRPGNGSGNGYGYGRGRGRDRDTYVVSCASNGRREFCEADTDGGVILRRQISNAECRQGYSWGFDRRGIWVDRGCRADFEVKR